MIVALIAGAVGLAVGSFLNVVIYRVPLGQSIVTPRSKCPSCEAMIAARDNVPVLSFLVLRARCRHCGAPISPMYPAVEAATGILFVAAFVRFAELHEAGFVAAVCAVLLAVAVIDYRHRRVPNAISVPAAGAAVVWVLVAGVLLGDTSRAVEALVTGATGFGLLFVIAVASGGIGFGDVKLTAFLGVGLGWFGWETSALGLFLGFVFGGLGSLVLLVLRLRTRKDMIPFAPALCAGAVVGLFAGPGPVQRWLGG